MTCRNTLKQSYTSTQGLARYLLKGHSIPRSSSVRSGGVRKTSQVQNCAQTVSRKLGTQKAGKALTRTGCVKVIFGKIKQNNSCICATDNTEISMRAKKKLSKGMPENRRMF